MSGGTRIKSSGVLQRLLHRQSSATPSDLVEADLRAADPDDAMRDGDSLATNPDILTGVMERHEMLLFNRVFQPFKQRGPGSGKASSSRGRRDQASSSSSGSPKATAHRESVSPPPPSWRRSKRGMTSNKDKGDAAAGGASSTAAGSGISAATLARMPPLEPLVGRERLLRRMNKLFAEREEKQLKLYGPEGSGKTAVAVEFAHLYGPLFPGGVIWLNGGSILWDCQQFLVDELGQAALDEELRAPALRERLWQYLNETTERWLLVVDDATEDVLSWVPPPALATNGCVLLTCKAKSGPDEALRVELPLLSAKSAADVVRQAAAVAAAGFPGRRVARDVCAAALKRKLSVPEAQALSTLTDTAHLCRSVLALRLAGTVMGLYNLSCADMLARVDALAGRTVMPDLGEILERYRLGQHTRELVDMGVIDTNDLVRGRPWTSLEGLSRKEQHLFEKIQENLFRSRNRLAARLVVKVWRNVLRDPAEQRGRLLWDALRSSSFFGSRSIPVALLQTQDEAPAAGSGSRPRGASPRSDGDTLDAGAQLVPRLGDMLWTTTEPTLGSIGNGGGGGGGEDEAVCVHASLQEAMRAVLGKPSEGNQQLARRALSALHSYCADMLFPAEHLVAAAAGKHFRVATMTMLPHIFMAVGLCGDLLTPDRPASSALSLEDAGDLGQSGRTQRGRSRSGVGLVKGATGRSLQRALADELPEDFVASRLPRRHSLFSVASGASSSKAGSSRSLGAASAAAQRSQRRSTGSGSSGSSTDATTPPTSPTGGSSSSAAAASAQSRRNGSGTGALKQLSRRLTSRGRRAGTFAEPELLLADLNMLQAFLLLLTPLGGFRFAQAGRYLRAALHVFVRRDDRAQIRAAKYLTAHCLLRGGQLRGAGALWAEVSDLASDKAQRALAKGALALAYGLQDKPERAAALAREAIALRGHTNNTNGSISSPGSAASGASQGGGGGALDDATARSLVAARNGQVLAYLLDLEGRHGEAVRALQGSLAVYEDACPLSPVCAEAHRAMAGALLRDGDPMGALQHAEEAASVCAAGQGHADSRVAEAWAELARMHVAQDDPRSAGVALVKSLAQSDRLHGQLAATPLNLARVEALADTTGSRGTSKRALAEYLSQGKRISKALKQWDALYGRHAAHD